jgi:hypothetical protein
VLHSNGGSSHSQGVSNACGGVQHNLNEPVWFTQTLGRFGSLVLNDR